MPQRTRLTFALLLLASFLLVVPAAFASGGTGSGGSGSGGGGGGGSSSAAINRVSAVAPCDAGTFVSVTLDKGANKQIEGTISMVGGTNADGTSTLYGGWTVMLANDTTGASLGGFGTSFGQTVPSVLITNLFGGVTAGSYDLSLTFTKRPFGELLGSTAPVLETCSAHFFVTAR
jgi:hypothetical protein